MVISLILAAVCFIIVAIDLVTMYKYFKKSSKVLCRVVSCEKCEIREDGFLTEEYWLTNTVFTYMNEEKSAQLKTDCFCSKGQVIKCRYFPQNGSVLRRCDLRMRLKEAPTILLNIGNLFIGLYIILSLFDLSRISKRNLAFASVIIIIALFAVLGIGQICSYIYAKRKTRKERVEYTKAEIYDVIRKTSSHKENKVHTYYPVYRYVYKGDIHTVQSKIGSAAPFEKGDTLTITVDRKKGGPVEYGEIWKSLALGISLLAMSATIVFVALVP